MLLSLNPWMNDRTWPSGSMSRLVPPLIAGLDICGQKLGRGYVKSVGEVEQPLVEQAASAVFDIDEHIARHTGPQGKGLLGHGPFDTKGSYALADGATSLFPQRDPLGTVLAGARRHAT
jgi:hypothetical protein